MTISLRPVDQNNYEAVCDLEVAPHQEDYVASNTWSLVEAAYNRNHYVKAIYAGAQLVGFMMWVQESPALISIWRFMIAEPHQNKGYGKLAMQKGLDLIRAQANKSFAKTNIKPEIEVCYVPENHIAKRLYAALGFVESGWDEDEEEVLARLKG
ncbi:GNAT family N-acetyltransferase [Halioxenophilus aromaticivorans]|uniref:GNAT family N-acetyltransferase n=1 Tax=Halioxenophilus aromaticivorans TaxID=1306992 RepID=A0AAV3U838_9ALTE